MSQKESTDSPNLNNYILQDRIGCGSFGKVYKVKDKKTNEIYAAKISINAIDTNMQQLFADISQEVNIISRLNHPSILKFILYSPVNFKKKPKPVIITEYASNGSLLLLIEHDRVNPAHQILDDTRKLIIIYGIASAMAYLHFNDILHRDLKPDNILMDSFYPKIADFGLSKSDNFFNDNMITRTAKGTIKGTPVFISPEIWEKGEYSKYSDVYAFSFILYQLLTLKKPFSDINIFSLALAVKNGKRPELDSSIPAVYKELIVRCWSHEPEKRPTFDQILVELRTDRRYITPTVNEEDYLNYIKYIDEYKTSFNSRFIRPPSFSKYTSEFLNDTSKIFLKEFGEKCSHFPFKYFKNLSDASRLHVMNADSGNLDEMFNVGRFLIEGWFDFPIDVKLGLDYIKASMDKGNKESAIYYVNMLIKGKLIPSNSKKARKLISSKFQNDESTRLLMEGRLMKNEKRYEESAELFKRSFELGNIESLYEYAELQRKMNKDVNEVIKCYKEAIDHEHLKSMFRYGNLLCESDDPEKQKEGFMLIKKAADNGYTKASYYYGLKVEKNEKENLKPNESESMKYFKEAADKGHVKSMNKYGLRLFNYIKSLPKLESFNEPIRYLKKASSKGCLQSMHRYAYILVYYDVGIPSNEKEGTKLFRYAAESGYADSIGEYATSLRYGRGIDANIDEAVKYYKIAIEKGSAVAMNDYAHLLENGEGVDVDYQGAIKYYKMAIDKGFVTSMSNYAVMLKNGIGCDVNYKEAIKYYKMAIENGDPYAMNNYGFMLLNGVGVDVDYKEAIKLFKLAIDKGDPTAMCNYARMKRDGLGVDVDYDEAIKYFRIAIDRGIPAAFNHYAYMIEHGLGVNADYIEALKYYKKAADKGYALAMTNCANILFNGKGGIQINKDEALKFYKLASDKKEPEAMLIYGLNHCDDDDDDDNNINDGISFIKQSAERGNADALYHYGRLMQENKVDVDDKSKFIEFYEKAAKKGQKDAINAIRCLKNE